MKLIYEFKENIYFEKNNGVKFGGEAFINGKWPKNPIGEDLSLLLTIDADKLNKNQDKVIFPEGKYISVFSTYNKDRYFLDDIVFFGDDAELEMIKSGFTKVTINDNSYLKSNVNNTVPQSIHLEKRYLSSDDYPAFSFLSDEIPNGVLGCEKLLSDYYFVCQIYSSDISKNNSGLLGLSDAIGYLFMRKEIENNDDAGLFFVQTA